MNIKLLSQEVINGDLKLDESFMGIDPKFVKLKKVNGTVWLEGGLWTEIPAWLKDVEIEGGFYCSDNKLKTLKNCPQKIRDSLICPGNKLISLEGCPGNVWKNFYCYNNLLKSLQGCPEFVGGDFWCENNKSILELPDYVKIGGGFYN